MIIQLEKNVSTEQRNRLAALLSQHQIKVTPVTTSDNTYLVAVLSSDIDIRVVGNLPGVLDVHRVTDSYKLVSRKWKVDPTEIKLGDGVCIGENDFSVIAGPCSIESEQQIDQIVQHLVKNNVKIMRGGVYKPRSSPYAFRGLGIAGLKLFHASCQAHNIKIISEVMQVSQIDDMIDYVDVFQVGARNAQNFNLLDALGRTAKPVMLKRGISGTIDELLQSAEYVFSAGNEKIILCERGIRTFENAYRNTFDINAIPILKEKSHLPVIADPSHGIGIRSHVSKIALAAMVAGADGVMTEIHYEPEKALSDGQQTLNFEEFDQLVTQINKLKTAMLK
ncbi:bifunctional 3-deoxy-7-phosphoheptulonate synthase/chorismate mutase [Flavobacterium sp. HSC-61S13]|uniref:bifunctional 3-deoxy-7-phosphoheptulonate synthase/chorismate mutase n=1 Tax=Flavobacterium sp. HSC-61S13 TaxID=2910963 RepID=UPI00209DA65A|nr:bifunctional 3-deoxy-7-phosphoheptulonate synthase/chorismate mutase [Flavobacterium sp. HSC-61S13]MCP1997376.1 3-deoxy-7-phosphoheptulonate synthase [Flavobacterium sp. HSC-61S13]